MQLWLGILLTTVMGLSLGLLGGGGSTLAVPILVYVLGLEAHPAIALSLVLVGSTALLAAWFHHRTTPIPWRQAALFAACGAPFSFLGALVSRRLPGPLLLLLFGALMLIAGGLMFRRRPEPPAPQGETRYGRIFLGGAGIGFLTGFLGMGGGFVIVPVLVLLLHIPIKRAVGASLLIIAANCAVGLVGHWPALTMQWGLVLPLSTSALLGTFVGVELCQRFSPYNLRRAFAVFILVVGLIMVVQNLPHLIR